MRLIEFVGENFLFLTAFAAFAGERFQMLEIGIPRAMLWCRSHVPSSLYIGPMRFKIFTAVHLSPSRRGFYLLSDIAAIFLSHLNTPAEGT